MVYGDETMPESSNVVGLSMRAFDMKHPAIAQIEAYWEALRGDRTVPQRSEVDPRGIEQSLENAFILERIAPQVARFRLAGMHLNNLMGMEVRGMPMTALFENDVRAHMIDVLEHVFEQPAKARFRLVSTPASGGRVVTGEMILMPLRSDLGDISRALGCIVTDGLVPSAPPHRFTLGSEELIPLGGTSRVHPATRGYAAPEPTHTAPGRAFHESAKPYSAEAPSEDAAQKSTSRPGYLRLVHDTDPGEDD